MAGGDRKVKGNMSRSLRKSVWFSPLNLMIIPGMVYIAEFFLKCEFYGGKAS
jgi:hypothetical protein